MVLKSLHEQRERVMRERGGTGLGTLDGSRKGNKKKICKSQGGKIRFHILYFFYV